MTMEIKILALYPIVIPALRSRPGVELRKRKDKMWTQIECGIITERPRSFARARYAVPHGTPPPEYRGHISLIREDIATSGMAVVLQPPARSAPADPEHRLLAPIFKDHQRLIFEFYNAEVLFVSPEGQAELRQVTVQRQSGEVTTRNLGSFNTRYTTLVARCEAQIAGAAEMFPMSPAPLATEPATLSAEPVMLRFGQS
jgi:hypothetical protein